MKCTALIFLSISLFCRLSIAQETASATAMGSFSITSYMTVTRLADLVFNNVNVGASMTVLSTSAQAARFLINGNSNTVVQVTITFPQSLTYGSSTLAITPFIPIYNTIQNAVSAVSFAGSSGGSASTGTAGNLYVWIGGRVTAASNQAAGNYQGTIQLVVTQP